MHLAFEGAPWCDEEDILDATEDPRESTCTECLTRAAAYGAAAAMRAAAVEAAGAVRDPELARERDEAIRRVDAINIELEKQRAFFCEGCLRLRRVEARALHVNTTSWCADCAPQKERA